MRVSRLQCDHVISSSCSLNYLDLGVQGLLQQWRQGHSKGCTKESQPEGTHSPVPGRCSSTPWCTRGDPTSAQQNKMQWLPPNSTTPQHDLPSLKILYKQVLLTGLTSGMAFFLFPGTHQELRGDSCSIDQSAIDSASGFDRLLGFVESQGWAWARQGYAIELLTGTHCGARVERSTASAQ